MPCVYFKNGTRINFKDRAFADPETVKRLVKAGAINIPAAPVDTSTEERLWMAMERRKVEDDPVIRRIVGELLKEYNLTIDLKKIR